VNITKRVRSRKQRDGSVKQQTRYVLQWNDGERHQRFYEKLADAQAARNKLAADRERGTYSAKPVNLTVADAVRTWLDSKRSAVRANTYSLYEFRARYATDSDIARVKVIELTTKQMRLWHSGLCDSVSVYSANKALAILKASLALAAEDVGIRPPATPSNLRKRQGKAHKLVLTPGEVTVVIRDADPYMSFPFLAGTRPSETLGLLWSAVDFDANVIRVERAQLMRTGELVESTKTEAGRRSVPMNATLRRLLLGWRIRCPRLDGELYRVFPALNGGPLLYSNLYNRKWRPTLKRLGLPAVSPHSARHSFISTLQAEGIPVATVARLAGHKSPSVTLGFYTHAMQSGDSAVNVLDGAFGGEVGATIGTTDAQIA
jgi:integrase